MKSAKKSLEGIFEHKLDAKFRVSVPADWRPEKGESLQLRLLEWKVFNVPILKALTDQAFEAMIASIDSDENLNAGQRSIKKGLVYSRNTPVTVNEQGKLLIPKKLAEDYGVESGGQVHLLGRGSNFDLVSPAHFPTLMSAEADVLADLYDSVDFS